MRSIRMTTRTIADVLRSGRRSSLAGRSKELRLLQQLAMPGGPVVAYVHGPAGIGKTTLLSALAADFDDAGIRNVRVQAGATEPTPESVVRTIAQALRVQATTVVQLANTLSADKSISVFMVDDVDTWRLVSTWLRAELLPALPANMRFIFAGAVPPPATWSTEYGRHFLELRLSALTREDSDAVVAVADLSPQQAERIWNLTAGHPLGLQMAIHACRSGSLDTVRDAGELANTILHAIGDSELRRAVEACAVVRRANRELMSAILEVSEIVPLALLEAVEALPFATRDAEGIYITEPVRQAIVEWMSGVDAERYHSWRKIAGEWIEARLRKTKGVSQWRYLADLLHLLEEPSLRNAFFPTDATAPAVEPARSSDFAEIFRIAKTRMDDKERERLEAWAQRVPYRFSVARGTDDEVLAFYVFARQDDPLAGLEMEDALFSQWRRHLTHNPVDGEVLFVRTVFASAAEGRAAARAACVLDLKRNYIERERLARIYCNTAEENSRVLLRLGFHPLPSQDELPDSMVLNVPGGNIVEWVCALVNVRSGLAALDEELVFARDRREITIDEAVVELTPLEAKVLSELMDHAPAVVRREDLIERVWKRTFVGSNVVDTVIRTLRKKLSSKRDYVQTVAKSGYRYVGHQRSPLA